MDTLAGLNFGAVIALNIQALGITEPKAVRQGTIRAGILAGGLLLVIYAMLAHVGALTGAAYPDCATGAETLTALASALFGRAGQVLLAAIFLLACFNTCVGLISCVGQYFHTLLPRIPYPAIAGFLPQPVCSSPTSALRASSGCPPRCSMGFTRSPSC